MPLFNVKCVGSKGSPEVIVNCLNFVCLHLSLASQPVGENECSDFLNIIFHLV